VGLNTSYMFTSYPKLLVIVAIGLVEPMVGEGKRGKVRMITDMNRVRIGRSLQLHICITSTIVLGVHVKSRLDNATIAVSARL
jgi:hypothetical protein